MGSLLGVANGTAVLSVKIEESVSAADLVSAVAGKRIKGLGWCICGKTSLGSNTTIKFTDGTTDHTGDMRLDQGCLFAEPSALGYFTLPVNTGLDITVTSDGTGIIDGVFIYALVD